MSRLPISVARRALATSEGAACVIGASGAAHHLFDPRTGRSAGVWRRLTVHHRSAAVADALSTALYAAAPDEIARDGREQSWSSGGPVGVSV